MVNITWLACPKCKGKFYVTSEEVGRGVDWRCPYCATDFKDNMKAQGELPGDIRSM